MGGRPDAALWRAGVPRGALEDGDCRLPLMVFVRLLNEAARETGDEYFGLHYGFERHPADLGLLGYVCMNMPLLGPMLNEVSRYIGLLGDGIRFESHDLGDRVMRTYSLPDLPLSDDLRRHEYDAIVAGAYHTTTIMLGESFRPIEVHLKHSGVRAGNAEYHRLFGVEPRFSMPQNTLVLPADLMRRRIVSADPALLALLGPHLAARAEGTGQTAAVVPEVERLIESCLPQGEPRVDQVAQALGVGTRTLQRRLASGGLTFEGLLRRVRERLARDYLAGPRLTLTEVAFLLGYSDVSAFNRAFRVWTGLSPSVYRTRRSRAPEPWIA